MSQPAVEFRDSVTAEDLDYLSLYLRMQDLCELAASGHTDVRRALEASVKHSQWTHLALVDGKPAALFGCGQWGTLLAPVGVPWLLGTEAVRRHGRVLQRHARAYIASMLEQYPRLLNAVHADNTVSIAWLKRLGFSFGPPTRSPLTGMTFYFFEMHRHV